MTNCKNCGSNEGENCSYCGTRNLVSIRSMQLSIDQLSLLRSLREAVIINPCKDFIKAY